DPAAILVDDFGRQHDIAGPEPRLQRAGNTKADQALGSRAGLLEHLDRTAVIATADHGGKTGTARDLGLGFETGRAQDRIGQDPRSPAPAETGSGANPYRTLPN